MNRGPTFEQLLADWLEEGPADAPDQILETVVAAVPSIPQRRAMRRVARANRIFHGRVRALAGIAAVIAIAVGALLNVPQLASNRIGGEPSASPAAPSKSPSPSATPINTAAWTTFASLRHGYVMYHPADWSVHQATAPWPFGSFGNTIGDPTVDEFDDTAGTRSFVVSSQKIPAGTTTAQWFASHLSEAPQNGCFPPRAAWTPIRIAGQEAGLHGGIAGCPFTEAVAIVGGRAYVFTGYVFGFGGDPGIFDRALLDAFLSTVQFRPGSADDRP